MYVDFVKREEFSKPYQQIDRRTFKMKQYIRGVIQAWHRKQETRLEQETAKQGVELESITRHVTKSGELGCKSGSNPEKASIKTDMSQPYCVVKFEPLGCFEFPETTV